MLNRITMLYWTRKPVFILLLAALLLLGGCTEEQAGDLTVGTASTVIGGLALCLLFHACHF
jgi:hypothetical protein